MHSYVPGVRLRAVGGLQNGEHPSLIFGGAPPPPFFFVCFYRGLYTGVSMGSTSQLSTIFCAATCVNDIIKATTLRSI
jgi:hypothetical protein